MRADLYRQRQRQARPNAPGSPPASTTCCRRHLACKARPARPLGQAPWSTGYRRSASTASPDRTNQAIDTATPGGKLPFPLLSAITEFERRLIRERLLDGLDTARAKGKGGRRLGLTELRAAEASRMYNSRHCSPGSRSRQLIFKFAPGCSEWFMAANISPTLTCSADAASPLPASDREPGWGHGWANSAACAVPARSPERQDEWRASL